VTINTPEEVVVHEAGHQFWYGIVGTNEFEHAWMDEGINTYATARAMAEDFPRAFHEERYFGGFIPWVFTDLPLRRETFWNRLAGYRRDASSDPASTPSYRFYPPTGGSITYNKTALWLNTMERWLGWPTLQRTLSTFFSRFQFQHPAPSDFFRTADEVSGQDLSPFFDQVYRSSNVFDYGVDRLLSVPSGNQFLTTVVVRRYGEALFPIDVRVSFEGGEEVTEHWDGNDRWHQYTYVRASRAVSAEVDPGRTLLLDIDETNNSKAIDPATDRAATKWSVKWMVWLEDALLSWGFLI
jgi:aminopeptidase N